MAGTLFLGGGGSDADERLLWVEMLNAATRRVLYWPFALPLDQHPQAEAWLRGAVERISAHVDLVTWGSLRDRHPSELAPFDLLFVGGGNTFRLLQHVQQQGFLQPVRDFVQSGGAYYGGSAGAVLACESAGIAIGHDPNEVEVTDLSALGLLAGMAVLPHYDRSQESCALTYSREHGCAVLGIPERSGLVVRDGEIRVVGSDAIWMISETDVFEREPGASWPLAAK